MPRVNKRKVTERQSILSHAMLRADIQPFSSEATLPARQYAWTKIESGQLGQQGHTFQRFKAFVGCISSCYQVNDT